MRHLKPRCTVKGSDKTPFSVHSFTFSGGFLYKPHPQVGVRPKPVRQVKGKVRRQVLDLLSRLARHHAHPPTHVVRADVKLAQSVPLSGQSHQSFLLIHSIARRTRGAREVSGASPTC